MSSHQFTSFHCIILPGCSTLVFIWTWVEPLGDSRSTHASPFPFCFTHYTSITVEESKSGHIPPRLKPLPIAVGMKGKTRINQVWRVLCGPSLLGWVFIRACLCQTLFWARSQYSWMTRHSLSVSQAWSWALFAQRTTLCFSPLPLSWSLFVTYSHFIFVFFYWTSVPGSLLQESLPALS